MSYAEPAKWVAKLRASKTDTHDLLFKTDMAAGHDGRSGRLRFNRAKILSRWRGSLLMLVGAFDGRLPAVMPQWANTLQLCGISTAKSK